MAEAGYGGQYTTATSTTRVDTTLRFDSSYLQTLPGITKVVQLVTSLLGFIFIEASGMAHLTRGTMFNFIALTAFWFTLIMLIFYLIHLIEKTYKIPWLIIEFGFCAIWTFGFLIVSIMAAVYNVDMYLVAAFFGFVAMVAYGFDAFLKYSSLSRGEIAQGDRVVTKQTTLTTQSY